MARIAFYGLGNMGLPMARNLLRAGHEVTGYDPVPAARAAATEAGLPLTDTPNAAAEGAEIIISMLPSGRHVLQLYAALVPQAAPGALLIDSSTIDVNEAREAHARAHAAGLASVDAPVSGGVGGAEAATLTFMVGGEAAAFAQAEPLLRAMGKNVVHCGGAGAGQAAKICNNMILGVSMIAVSEAFVLGEKLGLSHEALFRVASTSSGQCWSLTTYCPVPGLVPTSPANRDYAGGFAAALMLKDLRLSQGAAEAAGARTELGRAATDVYERFVAAGNGGVDFSGVVQAVRDT